MTDDAQYSIRIMTVYRTNSRYSPGLINNDYISYAYTGNQSFTPRAYEIIPLPERNALRTLQINPTLVIHAVLLQLFQHLGA